MSPAPSSGRRVLVVTPTYNEIDSLPPTLAKLFAAVPDVDVLVVDDASPDGTGKLADGMAADDPRIFVLHRTAKDGLGRAYIAGFAWAYEHGYSTIVEMDADGSHPATSLRAMLDTLDRPDGPGLVIGSRWTRGGKVVNWPKSREALSRAANLYARVMLRVPVRDITAGYRAYRADVLQRIQFDGIDSRGYCFQIDMTIRVHDLGEKIAEVPITFRDREAGVSKMSGDVVVEAMSKVTIWGFQRFFRRRTTAGPRVPS